MLRPIIAACYPVFIATGWLGSLPILANASGPAADEPEIWLVSTRHLGCASSLDPQRDLAIRRWDPEVCQWERRAWGELLGGPRLPTWIWVHGNRVESGEDRVRGLAWSRRLAGLAPDSVRRFRLIVWSWPSDQIRGPIRDVRAKAARADLEGRYLGQFLAHLPPAWPVGLIGFSFGARIATGACHWMGAHTEADSMGGAKEKHAGTAPRAAILLAAALPHDWLLPGKPHERALEALGELHVMINPCDRALRRFHVTDPCCRPCAMGVVGPAAEGLDPGAAARLFGHSGRDVGKQHDLYAYLWASSTGAALGELWQKLTGTTETERRQPAASSS